MNVVSPVSKWVPVKPAAPCSFGFDLPCRYPAVGFIGWRWVCKFHLPVIADVMLEKSCAGQKYTEIPLPGGERGK